MAFLERALSFLGVERLPCAPVRTQDIDKREPGQAIG